jgi:hypothetical protein
MEREPDFLKNREKCCALPLHGPLSVEHLLMYEIKNHAAHRFPFAQKMVLF